MLYSSSRYCTVVVGAVQMLLSCVVYGGRQQVIDVVFFIWNCKRLLYSESCYRAYIDTFCSCVELQTKAHRRWINQSINQSSLLVKKSLLKLLNSLTPLLFSNLFTGLKLMNVFNIKFSISLSNFSIPRNHPTCMT